MWIDGLIMTPVTVFLLWLFAYSAPAGRSRFDRVCDRLVMLVSVVAAVVVLFMLHRGLHIDGMGRSLVAVACAYLVFLTILALGWLRRFARTRKGGGNHPRKKEWTN